MRQKSAAKDGETLPEKVAVSEGGRTLEMTADQLDAVTAARRHGHGEAAKAQVAMNPENTKESTKSSGDFQKSL